MYITEEENQPKNTADARSTFQLLILNTGAAALLTGCFAYSRVLVYANIYLSLMLSTRLLAATPAGFLFPSPPYVA